MPARRALYVGPRLRRLRRDLGLTQAQMASELGVSASYVALIERNQRPLTAELLLRLAETFEVDLKSLTEGEGAEARLEGVFADPLLKDLDLAPGEVSDVAGGSPGVAEGLLRLFTAYKEAQLALADRREGGDRQGAADPLAGLRAFLDARRNHFPVLDERAERLAARADGAGGLTAYLEDRHGLAVRLMPPDVMNGAVRRYDMHRRALLLDDQLDAAARRFQTALQLSYLEFGEAIDAAVEEGRLEGDTIRLARRALASYAAGALMMPYAAFHREAEARGYDVEALARRFGASFEQVAHRLTTLQRPGASGVPFFFVRVDAAGNVSKRLDGAGNPFARHGGSCPLWSLHTVFRRPREVVCETVELPGGERFFTVARTVTQGGGAWGAPAVTRAVALGCTADQAHRLAYARGLDPVSGPATPIGTTCRLCQRADCLARAAPPIGRAILPDDYRRMGVPFGLADG